MICDVYNILIPSNSIIISMINPFARYLVPGTVQPPDLLSQTTTRIRAPIANQIVGQLLTGVPWLGLPVWTEGVWLCLWLPMYQNKKGLLSLNRNPEIAQRVIFFTPALSVLDCNCETKKLWCLSFGTGSKYGKSLFDWHAVQFCSILHAMSKKVTVQDLLHTLLTEWSKARSNGAH